MPSGSTGLLLLDSNILVCAVDSNEQRRSLIASELIDRAWHRDRGLVTSQIVMEFCAATVRGRGTRDALLDPVIAARWGERWLSMFEFQPITQQVVREAMRGAAAYQMHIYDAQVWASAKFAGAMILTEDAQSRPIIEGVQYVDPFEDGFTFDAIGL